MFHILTVLSYEPVTIFPYCMSTELTQSSCRNVCESSGGSCRIVYSIQTSDSAVIFFDERYSFIDDRSSSPSTRKSKFNGSCSGSERRVRSKLFNSLHPEVVGRENGVSGVRYFSNL